MQARRRGPAGVQEQGKGTLGFTGNLGGPRASLSKAPKRMNRVNNIQALGAAVAQPRGAKPVSQLKVSGGNRETGATGEALGSS